MDKTISELMSPMEPAKIMIPELKQLIIYFSKNTYRATAADSMVIFFFYLNIPVD